MEVPIPINQEMNFLGEKDISMKTLTMKTFTMKISTVVIEKETGSNNSYNLSLNERNDVVSSIKSQ